ncbi:Rho-type GTPase activating protein 20 [Encephalitozoon hellem]|uniref:Rho-type GTPase activating protein 20 n=1 Tax=Encephalitozoon hellem TaxID=27973 RepID=A0ABY8CRB5_ENCHE|nr:Rho-type GTPase activating protein 20 [Encephalitozoon hellem]
METTNDDGGSKKILYESLCTVEAENLSEACNNAIEGKRSSTGKRAKIARFVGEMCCCGDMFGSDTFINESVFSAMGYIEKNTQGVKDMFINSESEENVNNCVKLLELNEKIDYSSVHPKDVGMGFKIYVEENLKNVIPHNVRKRVIEAYKNKDDDKKKIIIPRIPFVLSDPNRMFLKSLKSIFLGIEANNKENEVDVDEIYRQFGPLIIRRPSEMLDMDTDILKAILIDLMKADFDEFPISFYP